ncbi:hypothetical protein GW17_00048494 [Ensete ventricosum]|nr:hypothetical protein GW17_00048494 [Ensete ventricosum]RZR82593.1 hypothetical protein BHM03_00009044 [Ensete ventricosum]
MAVVLMAAAAAPGPVAAGTTAGRGGPAPGRGGDMAPAIAKLLGGTGRVPGMGSVTVLDRDRDQDQDRDQATVTAPAAAAAAAAARACRREERTDMAPALADRVAAMVQATAVGASAAADRRSTGITTVARDLCLWKEEGEEVTAGTVPSGELSSRS